MQHDPNHIDPRLQAILGDLPADEAADLVEAWDLAGDASPVSAVARVSSWRRIEEATSAPAPQSARPSFRLLRLPSFRRYAVAASVVLVAVLGYLALPGHTLYVADSGESLSIELADGSSVLLASGSELRVRDSFGTDNRRVRLDGEGFFDITPAADNEGLSFEVQTFNASIEVLGTAFNVRAYAADLQAETRVAVEHGLVRVEGDSEAVELQAGQGTRVADDAPALPSPVDLTKATAWRDGGLAFDSVPMGVVFAELERRYDIRIEAPMSIARLEVSYWHQTPGTAAEVLSDLADVVDAEIRPTANGFQVYRNDR
ncbi:MAG: hypothetical protein HKN29_06550 [Rhodothermales bacterium]|nr:hypothetical protein [Rhodothermales bacterium]